jgi:hypothetical protein
LGAARPSPWPVTAPVPSSTATARAKGKRRPRQFAQARPPHPALRPDVLSTAEIDATMVYAEAEKALATRAAYASDWRDFAAWCASRGATALPAHVGIVAVYLR